MERWRNESVWCATLAACHLGFALSGYSPHTPLYKTLLWRVVRAAPADISSVGTVMRGAEAPAARARFIHPVVPHFASYCTGTPISRRPNSVPQTDQATALRHGCERSQHPVRPRVIFLSLQDTTVAFVLACVGSRSAGGVSVMGVWPPWADGSRRTVGWEVDVQWTPPAPPATDTTAALAPSPCGRSPAFPAQPTHQCPSCEAPSYTI